MAVKINNDWDLILKDQWEMDYYQNLRKKLIYAYRHYRVFPPAEEIFNALKLVSYKDCKVLILGQDPYHGPGQANGLAFSVNPNVALPPSLINIYKELSSDLSIPYPRSGDLRPWAKEGVLLLNATLTVISGRANSHKDLGWQILTDKIVEILGKREKPLVFILWGNYAQSKIPLISNPDHLIIKSPHPSPLSAHRGFFGSKPFSRANAFLQANGQEAIDWTIK